MLNVLSSMIRGMIQVNLSLTFLENVKKIQYINGKFGKLDLHLSESPSVFKYLFGSNKGPLELIIHAIQ